MGKTIKQAQQELAENCGYKDEIIWDLLSSDNVQFMKNKIKQLIPDQEKGQNAIINLRANLFESIWRQRKYTNKTSVTFIFYVLVSEKMNAIEALNSTQFSCHPVFRCKKCSKDSDSTDCCMIYVDEIGRVYQNWKSYLEENVLPAGIMVTPRKGVYNFDHNHKVILDCYITPNASDEQQALNALQTSSSVLGLGAACVPLAGLFLPIAAPLMATAGVVGLGVGAFTSITSALNLRDRRKHEQSISVSDSQARASYIGVFGGALGIFAAGATRSLTKAAAAGKATARMQVLVNGMNISSIVLSGSGTINGILDIIFKLDDGEKIASMDILQLAASLALFTHSVYNFQLASKIANNARGNTITSYRETLTNRQKKMFDKLSKETVRIRGNTQGKIDIIRSVNEIPDRQYLNDLIKINKQLNQRNIRPAFGESGKGVVLNNELPVDTGALRNNIQNQQGPNILSKVTSPIPSNYNVETTHTAKPLSANSGHPVDSTQEFILKEIATSLPRALYDILEKCGKSFISNIADFHKFSNVILSMAEHLIDSIFKYLIELTESFIEDYAEIIHKTLKLHISTESFLYRILQEYLNKYKSFGIEYLRVKGEEIKKAVKCYFLKLNSNNSSITATKCPDCKGTFKISQLY